MQNMSPANVNVKKMRFLHLGISVFLPILVASCSSPDSQSISDREPLFADSQSSDLVNSESAPMVLAALAGTANLISEVPAVEHTVTRADSGIQITYTSAALVERARPQAIEEQWIHMQSCLGQIASAPAVLVIDGPVAPYTVNDDVVRNETLTAFEITSMPVASAHTIYGKLLQVSIDDFDGSLGMPLFNLRSIMGRYLWQAAELPSRDYPFSCAQSAP